MNREDGPDEKSLVPSSSEPPTPSRISDIARRGLDLAHSLDAPVQPPSPSTLRFLLPTERVVQFPDDYSLGDLFTHEPTYLTTATTELPEPRAALPYGEELMTKKMKGAKYLGEARGQVKVPPGTLLRLSVGPSCDTVGLERLGALDLQFLSLAPTPKSSEQSLSHIRGLALFGLDISLTPISGAGLAYLEQTQNMQLLDLGNTEFTAEGMPYLGKFPHLKSLDLVRTYVQDSDLRYLSLLPKLTALNLGTMTPPWGRLTGEGITHLRGLTNLRALSLNIWPIGDAAIQTINSIINLADLRLQWTQITDQGLRSLKVFSHLSFLDLAHTQVTNDGMKFLHALPELTGLSLWGTSVDDRAVEHLRQLERLRHLELSYTGVTEDGLRVLRDALPECRIGPAETTRSYFERNLGKRPSE